jgi:hypothetical protein
MTERRRKFDQDFRDGAVRIVRETGDEAPGSSSELLGEIPHLSDLSV